MAESSILNWLCWLFIGKLVEGLSLVTKLFQSLGGLTFVWRWWSQSPAVETRVAWVFLARRLESNYVCIMMDHLGVVGFECMKHFSLILWHCLLATSINERWLDSQRRSFLTINVCHLFPDTYVEKDGRCISCAEKLPFASAPNHIAPFVLYKVNVYTALFWGPLYMWLLHTPLVHHIVLVCLSECFVGT